MSVQELDKKWRDAVDYLNNNYAYFLTEVLNIGKPSWDPTVPTAAVALKDDADKSDGSHFKFVFGPAFAEQLSVEQFAAIMAHETLHILLEHLWMVHPDSRLRCFKDLRRFNIAADCVINDYLSNYGFEFPDGVVHGDDVVGFDCSAVSIHEVYHLIEQMSDEEFEQKFGGDGFTSIDIHDWMTDATPEERREMAKALKGLGIPMPDDCKDLTDPKEYTGNGVDASRSPVDMKANGQDLSLAWHDLLKKVDPDIVRKKGFGRRELSSFRTPRRKLIGFPSGGAILPVLDDPVGEMANAGSRTVIALALDTSGSISRQVVDAFVGLAQSIPSNKVDVVCCSFTTDYMELDLDNPVYHGGGTCFSAIEEFIKQKVEPDLGNYPSAVIVVSDGEAEFYSRKIAKEHKDNWHWLLCNGHDPKGNASSHSKNRLVNTFSTEQVMDLREFIN